MLRHPHHHQRRDLDFWSSWSPLPSFPSLVDRDMRRLMDLLSTPPSFSSSSSYCDSNGVLTLTPTYRVVARQSSGGGSGSDGDKKSGMTIEVDIPGVRKDAVALDAQGNRLKLVAAKYSPDGRSAWCTSSSSSKRRRNNNKKVDGGKKTSSDDAQQQKDDDGGGGGKILPSIVYKLHLRISSRADIEQARASYRGDGVLLIGIPYKTEEVKKISINIED